ncbi:hydrogenase maturation protease [Candidatus Accumulibacter sp. ACC003]|uniref:hydrogenase maturation protease n=1 Tax=Candidatus Accumulibacter sp. ACC003 TaxID=2823334 RepID=UPI0025C1F94E|nr:hydrogenase maturation protease [Candidatus Accumulibacter sp. ACC003]
MPLPPVVILACGNPSRGDDALGPLLLERLQSWLDASATGAGCELLGDFQLQIEHALDLVGRRLLLFIDAGQQTPAPFVFRQAQAADGVAHSTHALTPEALLAVLLRIDHEPPPPAFVLCVRGESFALGEDLSAAAASHADAAFELLEALLRRPELDYWQSLLSR